VYRKLTQHQRLFFAAALLIVLTAVALFAALGTGGSGPVPTEVAAAADVPRATAPDDCSGCGGRLVHKARDCSFLPTYASVPNPSLSLRPIGGGAGFDESVTAEAVKAVFKRFNDLDGPINENTPDGAKFKDINFQDLWDDETVNAFAFVGSDGKPVVQIMGGMLRHPYMQIEGITLVLAHEVGHHSREKPVYSDSGLSCEGQADYWATLRGLRKFYATEAEYKEKVVGPPNQPERGAIGQAYKTLTRGLAYNYNSYEAQANLAFAELCAHPHPSCRKLIYEAGVAKTAKPTCLTGTGAGFALRFDFSELTTPQDAKNRYNNKGFAPDRAPKSRQELLLENKQLRDELEKLKKGNR